MPAPIKFYVFKIHYEYKTVLMLAFLEISGIHDIIMHSLIGALWNSPTIKYMCNLKSELYMK